MHVGFLFLLTFALFGADQSKVLIEVGVPGADFYLDGNFVQQTDAHGNLQMEDFPPGAFRFTVKKDGYQTYHGSFSLAEGESKNIHVLLRQIIPQPKGTASRAPKQVAESTKLSPGGNGDVASLKEEPSKPIPEEIAVAARPIRTQAADGNFAIWAIPFGLAVLLFLGFIIRQQKARRTRIEPPIEQMPVSIPGFIESLKRQDELTKAGFVKVKALDAADIDKREKEIVIVLPKEAYTSEEEK